jgi:RNA polymerase sigma-70 factor (ECF subfamily)
MQVMEAERLAHLMDAYAAALVLYARQWCRAPDDVVQEAFLELAGLSGPPNNAAAWLYRVVRNRAVSAGRAEQRRRRHEGRAAARHEAWFVPSEGAGLDADAARDALEALPGELREPVAAHLWGGLTFEEIGALTGVSASTAHRRYLEGLARLRERLRVPCPDQPTNDRRPRG